AYNSNQKAVGVIESYTDSIRISVYQYQSGALTPLWNMSNDIIYPFIAKGHPDSTQIIIQMSDQTCSFDGTNKSCFDTEINFDTIYSLITTDNESSEVIASISSEGNLSINGTVLEGTDFIQMAAVDLDNSQNAEIIGLTRNGELYVFNASGTLYSNFPIQVENAKRLLIYDLYGDEYPEIVVQNSDDDLITINWKGKIDYTIANPSDGELVQLGIYKGKNAIFTTDAVWTFDESNNQVQLNSWPLQYQNTSQTRILNLEFEVPIHHPDIILDTEKTYAYPNPAQNGYVKIRCVVGDVDKITCEIFDIAGYFTERFTIDRPIAHEPNEILWNVKEIEPGVYFANVKVQKGSIVEHKILRIGVIQ
ncbi:MAG: T9SS type A sorting domain-containing protein, partial [Simkaniaceae bacterium]|nr:T9SS type A sorting domain-containing protein [Simkaniaceae bacterium]